MSDILEGVREFVRAKSAAREGRPPVEVADDQSLLRCGVIDSMGIFELVTFLEDRFGVKIRDEEILRKNFESIGRIAEFIGEKLKG